MNLGFLLGRINGECIFSFRSTACPQLRFALVNLVDIAMLQRDIRRQVNDLFKRAPLPPWMLKQSLAIATADRGQAHRAEAMQEVVAAMNLCPRQVENLLQIRQRFCRSVESVIDGRRQIAARLLKVTPPPSPPFLLSFCTK